MKLNIIFLITTLAVAHGVLGARQSKLRGVYKREINKERKLDPPTESKSSKDPKVKSKKAGPLEVKAEEDNHRLCSAHKKCERLGEGPYCCPTVDEVYLDCCEEVSADAGEPPAIKGVSKGPPKEGPPPPAIKGVSKGGPPKGGPPKGGPPKGGPPKGEHPAIKEVKAGRPAIKSAKDERPATKEAKDAAPKVPSGKKGGSI